MSGLEVKGFASVFNVVDALGDVVIPGALYTMAAGGLPAMMFEHEGNQVGAWTRMTETLHGLYLEGVIYEDWVRRMVEAGSVVGLSIGYRSKRTRGYKGRRVIVRGELLEVSIVTNPANQSCLIDAYRSKGESKWTHRKQPKKGRRTSATSQSAGPLIEACRPD